MAPLSFALSELNGNLFVKRNILLSIGVSLSLLAGAFSRPTYRYPESTELHRKARYLERIISTPEAETPELLALGNAEWSLFSMSYSVYAFTNMAQRDSSFRPKPPTTPSWPFKRC